MVHLKKEMDLLRDPIYKAVQEVLESGSYILGNKGKELESKVSRYVEAAYGAGVASGTDALVLSLEALGIGEGDEVITTPFTFFATAEAIVRVGAKPVFVDINPNTYHIQPSNIYNALNAKTKAIIVVHLFGHAANMDEIMQIAKEYGLRVIEDACQAIGTEYKGKRVGAIGDVGCFSFYPSKNLGGVGDGGMVVTNSQDVYEKICELRNHGSEKNNKYKHSTIGYNSRLDELQAAILLEKLKYLDDFLIKRREIARRYTEELNQFVKTPSIYLNRTHTFHQYCIELDNRDELASYLIRQNIATAIYYPIPLHLQQAFLNLNYKKGDFPIAEKISNKILALPIYPLMDQMEQDKVIKAIKEFFQTI
ncbi:DegT/DnrJ/EryC1/StrS family aminotransferase [Aeribacillus alveayuensis]|jgi:UDP-2-acetamido-2-deoxy-ribo-hexuluronate aminotransferase